jgi:low affinity Fe/Cu permease
LAARHQHRHDDRDIPNGFLIQATQNRDTLALQSKLDELIFATKNARNHIAGIEDASDEEIGKAKVEMQQRPG